MGKKIALLTFFSTLMVIWLFFNVGFTTGEIGIMNSRFMSENGDISYLVNRNDMYCIDENGKLLLRKKLPTYKDGIVYSYKSLKRDEQENFYIVVTEETEDSIISYVQKFSPRGHKKERILEYDENITGFSIYSATYKNNELTIWSVAEKDNRLREDVYSPKDGIIRQKDYEFNTYPGFLQISKSVSGSTYYIGEDNSLYCLENALNGDYNKKIDLAQLGFKGAMPSQISSDADGNIYFSDLGIPRFLKYNEKTKEVSEVYALHDEVGEDITYEQLDSLEYVGKKLFSSANAGIVNGNFIFIMEDNQVKIIDHWYLPLMWQVFYVAVAFALSYIAFWLIYRLARVILRSKKIFVKQISAMLLVFLVGTAYIAKTIDYIIDEYFLDEILIQLYTTSSAIAKDINGDKLKQVQIPWMEDDAYFNELKEISDVNLDEFYDIAPDTIKRSFEYAIFANIDGISHLLIAGDKSEAINFNGRYEYYDGGSVSYKVEGYNTENKNVEISLKSSHTGDWLECRYAVLDSNQNKAGEVEVSMNYGLYMEEVGKIIWQLIMRVLVVMLVIVALFIFMSKRTLRGLGKLKQGVDEVSEGNWNAVVDINSNDEVEEIGNAFNKMSRHVRLYMDSIEKLNDIYEKFVPKKISEILNKTSMMEVNKGDHVSKQMSIVTISAGNFYRRTESMSPTENFKFTDKLYSNLAGSIKRTGGMIEDYRGSGLRAIYDSAADYCLDCALSVLEQTDAFELGIYAIIQHGDVIFGIVGNENDTQAVAVSRAINYTPILEKMAMENSIPLIITARAMAKIQNTKKYQYRYIGKIKSNNDTELLDVYDVLNAYRLEERNSRLLTAEIFQEGVRAYINADMQKARKCFIDVVRIDAGDKLARTYIFLCDKYMNATLQDFTGAYE